MAADDTCTKSGICANTVVIAFYWMSYEKSRSVLLSNMAIDNSSGPVDAMIEFQMAFAAGAISGMVCTGLNSKEANEKYTKYSAV